MRSSSAGALADMRDTWEALLREHEGEELALAREIFAAANTLAAHRGLSRALTDPSRDDDDRAQRRVPRKKNPGDRRRQHRKDHPLQTLAD